MLTIPSVPLGVAARQATAAAGAAAVAAPSIPVVGLGVYQMDPGASTTSSILAALRNGYRHIDTAAFYGNEADVGKAVTASGLKRDEVFITTKIWIDDMDSFDSTVAAGRASVKRLGLSYADMILLHAPVVGKRIDAYRALIALQREGLTRHVGVSNYNVHHLEELFALHLPPPACNQIELHPFLQRRDVTEYCEERGITIVAYSPLAKGKAVKHPAVIEAARALKRTPAQVVLRWGVQHGFVIIPKSTSPERQVENATLFDFDIPDSIMVSLDALECGMTTGWNPLAWK